MSNYTLNPDGTATLLVPTSNGPRRLIFDPQDVDALEAILTHISPSVDWAARRPVPRVEPPPNASETYLKFAEYHRMNPGVYVFLVTRALEAKDAGYPRIGSSFLLEQARWEFGVKARNTAYEINNDTGAYYARLIQMHEPQLYGFLEVRRCIADEETGWAAFKEARDPAKKKPVRSVEATTEPLEIYDEEGALYDYLMRPAK